ncbi:MAG: ATP synthase subunit I [Lachnospira sp.]|nr:ATP synthase subunit I [Lachnospira sp.]MDD5828658.1 ATP synthase subunit I [Lachnospira sp.]
MLKKLKDLNEALPGMLLINLIYFVIGEIIICSFFKQRLYYSVGFAAGVVYSVFSSFHMSFRIRNIVYGGASEKRTLIIGYMIRLAVMLLLFVLLYFTHAGDLLCMIIGMFSMKVAAYLQPITDIIKNNRKGR